MGADVGWCRMDVGWHMGVVDGVGGGTIGGGGVVVEH